VRLDHATSKPSTWFLIAGLPGAVRHVWLRIRAGGEPRGWQRRNPCLCRAAAAGLQRSLGGFFCGCVLQPARSVHCAHSVHDANADA
jgi:hypothetical protein